MDRQSGIHTFRSTESQMNRSQIDRQLAGQTVKWKDNQKERQSDRQTDNEIDRQTGS